MTQRKPTPFTGGRMSHDAGKPTPLAGWDVTILHRIL